MKNQITSTIRNTSCSHGWLKQLNQVIFGIITVLLFILLIAVVLNEAISNNKEDNENDQSTHNQCLINSCSVTCANTALQSLDAQLAFAIKNESDTCGDRGLKIDLSNPQFNDETIPSGWMDLFGIQVKSLIITGGNLKKINRQAFMSSSFINLKSLTFESVTISVINSETFIGLSSLLELNIRSCHMQYISETALTPIDHSLKSLQIKDSSYWNPRNITGSLYLENLTVVDLTFNNFSGVLDKFSFQGLEYCRLLYLSSNRITALGEGTFDYLNNINRIDLNDNLLKTLPERIFDRIIALSTNDLKIDLHDNPWHCDCSLDNIRQMYKDNYIIIDPVCHTPTILSNTLFSNFDTFCKIDNHTTDTIINVNNSTESSNTTTAPIYINTMCRDNNTQPVSLYCESYTDSESNSRELVQRHGNVSDQFLYEVLHKTLEVSKFEMVWFQTLCPTEIYCLLTIPRYLTVLNESFHYCLVDKSDLVIKAENCFSFLAEVYYSDKISNRRMFAFIYAGTVLGCTITSAAIVFVAVRRNPALLRGSKRVLMVKHRVADAIILPPKFSGRSNFVRYGSVRSDKSGTPSYISALQPTEDQLTMWRLSHLFDKQMNSINVDDKGLSIVEYIVCNENAKEEDKIKNENSQDSFVSGHHI